MFAVTGTRKCVTHMLFEHEVLHTLHDKLRAGIHDSGEEPVEVEGEGDEGGETDERGKKSGGEQG